MPRWWRLTPVVAVSRTGAAFKMPRLALVAKSPKVPAYSTAASMVLRRKLLLAPGAEAMSLQADWEVGARPSDDAAPQEPVPSFRPLLLGSKPAAMLKP